MSSNYIAAADARIAASILLLRDGEDGLEVLMLRRADRAGDMRSGAAVFPGGVVDAGDREAQRWCLGPDDAAFSARLGLAQGGGDYAVAALRECFEEVGLLLACGVDGQPFDVAAHEAALHPWRAAMHAGSKTVGDLCSSFGLRLDLRGLAYYSHWLTPPGTPKRFDTRFFCALAPNGQTAVADLAEAQELMWLTPAQAMDAARGLTLLPVTRRTLKDLSRFSTAAQAFAEAQARRDIPMTMPRVGSSSKGRTVVLPDEFAYAEIGRLDPLGRGDVSTEIIPGRVVDLSARVRRITAPNAGMMTGPGTNTYIVSDSAASGCTVIDPGPADAAHVQAIIAAAPLPIARILVTHTHKDHSPGAALLAQATGAPVWGRHALHPAWQDDTFAPQRELVHGDVIALGESTTLRVVHTPGHASNHLCFLLEEEQLLFTGDHVMQGSTVVINPPDGDMAAYLKALQALLDIPLQWLAPGHGFLVGAPHDVLRALIKHRLAREAKVVAALRRHGPCTVVALVADVYADVPTALHTMAQRSLTAHLLKLEGDGAAARDEATAWRYIGAA
jgi:glyoxylase-like metal-dependent hydrolase (beta-lactamase superfamily II)/8-oxo-dGTP pyrophosphatase MutT (NUDIX family)